MSDKNEHIQRVNEARIHGRPAWFLAVVAGLLSTASVFATGRSAGDYDVVWDNTIEAIGV